MSGAPTRSQSIRSSAPKARETNEAARQRRPFSATRGWSPAASDAMRLRVGGANDPSEAEADAAAEHVLSDSNGAAPSLGERRGASAPRAKPSALEGSVVASPRLERQIAAATADGRTLAPEQRDFFEPRFNNDFARVRIHDGPLAAKAARDAGAEAFALGDDIFFGAGAYQPDSEPGRRLLAHELAHTIQARPDVIARRALPLRQDLADASADAGPADPGVEEAADALTGTPEGDEDVARDALKDLDGPARSQALGRMRERLPAGEADRASGLARAEVKKPGTKDASTPANQAAGTGDVKGATLDERRRGVETRSAPAAPAPVDAVPGAPPETPMPTHERASASARSKMQEAVRTVSGEAETGSAGAELAVAPDAPRADKASSAPAPLGAGAAAALVAAATLGERLAELEQARSLPIHFQDDSDRPPGDPVAFARQRESAAVAASFVGRAAEKIQTVIAAALGAPPEALAALDAARAEVQGQVAALGAAVRDDAGTSRKSVSSQAAHVRSAIDARHGGADSAAAKDIKSAADHAKTSHDDAKSSMGNAAEAEKADISKSYQDAEAPMAAIGDAAAGKAVAAGASWKAKLPPYQTDWSILDGPVENDRIDAKKEAVDKVVAEYGKSFRESAADQAKKIPDSKSEVLAKIDEITRQAGVGLTAQLEQINQGASAQEKGAKGQSKQSAQKIKAALNSSATQNLAALDAAERQHGSALDTQGAGALEALDKSTAAGISGLADGVSQASNELIGSIHDFVASTAETPPPPHDELVTALDETSANVEGPVTAMASQIATVAPALAQTNAALSEQSSGALTATAAAAKQGFDGIGSAFATSATGVNEQAAHGFASLVRSNRKAANAISANAKTGFLDAGRNASAAYKGFGDQVEDNFRIGREQMLAGLWSKETQTKLNNDMDEYAQKAADEVQPRWKKWVKVLITIVVIVAVILITVATAGALGPVGVVLLGAALGAAAGAVQTIAENLIDGKPWSKGVVKAMIVGAIGGAVGGAGGVLLKGVGSVALKIGLEAGINIVGGVAGEAVGSLAVGQTINWTGALMGALIGAGIGAGLGIAGALKGKIRIGGLGEPAAPAPRPTIEPPPPAGKLRSFLQQSKILAPRPGAPMPEVNVGAGAAESSAPTPGAVSEPAPRPVTAPEAVAPPSAAPKPAAAPSAAVEPAPTSPAAPELAAPAAGAEAPTPAPAAAETPSLTPAEGPKPVPGSTQKPATLAEGGGSGSSGETGAQPVADNVRPIGSAEAGAAGEQPRLRTQRPLTTAEDFAARAKARDAARALPDQPPTEPQVQRMPVAEAAGAEGQAPRPVTMPEQPKLGVIEGGGQASKPPSMTHEAPTPRTGGRADGRSTFEPKASAEAGGGKPTSSELGGPERPPAKPLEPVEAAPAKKPARPAGDQGPAKSKPSAKSEDAPPSAKFEEAAPPAKPEEAAPSTKPEEAGPSTKAEPFDMTKIGADTEPAQILDSANFNKVKLKPGQDALYILRDSKGTILKAGKTSYRGAKARFRAYKNGAKIDGIEVELEVHPLNPSEHIAEHLEGRLRESLKSQGHALPWDKTGQHGAGFGTPGEGIRTGVLTKGEMEELLTRHKGNLQEAGREIRKHKDYVRLLAKNLGLVPKDFK
jgi:hypothetical protein